MNLTPPSLKLFLLIAISLIAILVAGSDLISFIQAKKNEKILEQLQIQKEKILSKKMETSVEQKDIHQLRTLNPFEACFTLTRLCETHHLFLTKIQVGKYSTQTKKDTFEILLNLSGDYFDFVSLLKQLTLLPWNIEWQTLHIISLSPKPVKKNQIVNSRMKISYPLEITLKLAIFHHYLPNKKSPSPIQQPTSKDFSPFTLRRHAGKLIDNGKAINLMAIGEPPNVKLEIQRTDALS